MVSSFPHVPPDAVVDHAGPTDRWQPVDGTNPAPRPASGGVWLTDSVAVKCVPIEHAGVLDAEVANASWLSDHARVPAAATRADGSSFAWLVTGRLDGVPAHRPDLHGDVGSLAEVAGTALRELHAVPVEAAPDHLDRGWGGLESALEASVARGIGDVEEPYQRYSAAELLDLWRQGRPATEDLVICHGKAELPNMLAKLGAFAGWVDLATVRLADRHLDLAYAHASIHRYLGPEAVYIFYDTYGSDPDLLRLDHYLLAKQLLP